MTSVARMRRTLASSQTQRSKGRPKGGDASRTTSDTWEGACTESPTRAFGLQCDDSGDHQQAEPRKFWLGNALAHDPGE